MNDHFRACVREVFSLDIKTNEWHGRWDVAGTKPDGERGQIQTTYPVSNINHPVAERERAVTELYAKTLSSGLIPMAGTLALPKRDKHLARYLA